MNTKVKQKIKWLYNLIQGKRIYSSYQETIRAELIFYINYLKEGMTVFDVGSNIGEMSLLFSNLVGSSGKVYAFEASNSVFERFDKIIKASERKQVIGKNLAISDVEDLLKLYVFDNQNSGLNSLANRPLEKYGVKIESKGSEYVRSITIDNFCLQNDIKMIDLLKIDVEGAEYQVLLGAKEMLRGKKIKCCTFEFGATTFDMGNNPNQIESYLNEVGYSIRNLMPGEPNFPGRRNAQSAQFAMHIAKPK